MSNFIQNRAIYLSGPMEHCTDEEKHGWRDYVKSIWPGHCFDPCRRVYNDESAQRRWKELVEYDKADIASSDALVVNYKEPVAGSRMTGTTMEIPYGFYLGKMIITVTPYENISPWVRYHSHFITDSFDKAIAELIEYYSDRPVIKD
jgi:hypothetical protein